VIYRAIHSAVGFAVALAQTSLRRSRRKLPAEPDNAAEIVQADVLDDGAVNSAIAGADAVFNLVGILTETAPQTYRAIHVEGARRVALAAQRHGVMRVIHISALGAAQNRSPSRPEPRVLSSGSQVRTANVSYEIPEGQRRVIVNLDTLE
jgi:nucleoside-diphosphate-sugar epimerase